MSNVYPKNYAQGICRDNFLHTPSQWETMLYCNIISHWLGAYTKWSLIRHFLIYFRVTSFALGQSKDHLWMRPANERRCHIVMSSLIGWVHPKNDPCQSYVCPMPVTQPWRIWLTYRGIYSDTIWSHRSRSTLSQVMAWCLRAPRHYLNQCWLISSKVFCDTDLRAIAQELLMDLICNICLDIKLLKLLPCLKFQWNLPGASELTHWPLGDFTEILKKLFSS